MKMKLRGKMKIGKKVKIKIRMKKIKIKEIKKMIIMKKMKINCISVRVNVHNQHPAIAKSKLDTPPQNQH